MGGALDLEEEVPGQPVRVLVPLHLEPDLVPWVVVGAGGGNSAIKSGRDSYLWAGRYDIILRKKSDRGFKLFLSNLFELWVVMATELFFIARFCLRTRRTTPSVSWAHLPGCPAR